MVSLIFSLVERVQWIEVNTLPILKSNQRKECPLKTPLVEEYKKGIEKWQLSLTTIYVLSDNECLFLHA